jgi:hypothetical protein
MQPGIEMVRLHQEDLMRAAECHRRAAGGPVARRSHHGRLRIRLGRGVIALGARIAGETHPIAHT